MNTDTGTDFVLLYIDNCQQAFSDILLFVNRCDLKKWKARARAIRSHIRSVTPRIMRHGLPFYAGKPDAESAKYLVETLNELPSDSDAYWRSVFDYYKQKLQENGVPQEDPELRAEFDRKAKQDRRRMHQDADMHALLYAAGSLAVFGSRVRGSLSC